MTHHVVRAKCARLLGSVLILCAPAIAPAETLSIDRALALAEQHSPRLKTAQAEVERARSGIRTAQAYANPEIEALTGGVRGRVPGVTSGQGVSVSIGQPIDLPTQRAPRIRSAEFGLESSKFALQEMRLLLRADVKQAFYLALRRKAEYELAQDNLRLLEEIRKRIELSVSVGERAKFELVRVDAELASAKNQTASAQLRVSQALAQLRVLVAAPLPDILDVAGDLVVNPSVGDLGTLRVRLTSQYPALRRMQAEVNRQQARLDSERALRTPRPTLFLGVDRDPEQTRSLFGVSIPIPLWDQRQGPIGEAVGSFQQASMVAEQARLELLGELEVAYNRFLVARQQVAAFEGGMIRQAENALKVAEAAYRFGERGFLEVLDAQRVLRSIRADFLTARFEKQAALVELERLTTTDVPGESK